MERAKGIERGLEEDLVLTVNNKVNMMNKEAGSDGKPKTTDAGGDSPRGEPVHVDEENAQVDGDGREPRTAGAAVGAGGGRGASQ